MTSPILPDQASCADPEPAQTLRVAEALKYILDSLAPITDIQRLPLRDALNRVLAADVISPLDVPGHTNSAMDGYALPGGDLPETHAREYRVIGTAYAGLPFAPSCGPGECVRIMTGAPMPSGTDSVVMQEQVKSIDSGRVQIGTGHRVGQNVRQTGEDIAKGSPVLTSGRRLTAADIGVLASLGIGEINVHRRPRVAFFSTGDELRSIGEALKQGEVYDSNRYSLYGMLKRQDVEILDLGVVPDDPQALRQAFTSAAAIADLVISSGGVSVGEADYTRSILQELGSMNFWKIAMKPGRPLAFGRLGSAWFFGLPGNPVAVMVTFYQFVLPALEYLATGRLYQPFILNAVCSEAIRKRPGRYEILRGFFTQGPDGDLSVMRVGQQGSGILTSMSLGNCFILLPEDCNGISPGDKVRIQPFNAFQ